MFETVQSDLNLFVIYMIRSLIENVAGLYVERWFGKSMDCEAWEKLHEKFTRKTILQTYLYTWLTLK